jgi:hypothetical protein
VIFVALASRLVGKEYIAKNVKLILPFDEEGKLMVN